MRSFLLDLFALAGFGAFLYGAHQVYPPAAFMLGGLIVGGAAVAASTKRSDR